MRKIVKITHQDGQVFYLQGFDYTGIPCTGVKETAQKYPEWAAFVAAKNAANALYEQSQNFKQADVEDSE